MYTGETQIRVRYAETDRMGYVYYGNYAAYFEVGRVEALRNLGYSYKSLEDSGIILPVFEYSIRYMKPAYYDDLLLIKTVIPEIPGARIKFRYETYNQDDLLLNTAETTLVFIDSATGKPRPAPGDLVKSISGFF
ncbi:MAG: acyl-CoA thioesterase [Bacteroidetes bacterium]|nr:MAG: acyl-CoA thioesterase [Bacteroidota bacterium]REK07038.1 MAG: acyl-CoA thioesterase [Bacteroidota bacterium]REK33615.1 MAG: acyl-CoA thioesterase [Bacteroidota bacterium]REK48600.1 MAG: acyl-CoA thioesterase [Bacteroidota bacterium]